MITSEWNDPLFLIFVLGFVIVLASTQFKSRRKMMFTKFLGDHVNALYTFMMGGMSGALGGVIAGLGALIQALTPDEYLKKTLWPRIILATILAVVSLYFFYEKPVDLLPMIAIVFCRFMELHHDAEKIRWAFFWAGGLWVSYFIIEHIPLMALTSGLMSAMLLVAILRHRKNDKTNRHAEPIEDVA
ncbi:MAG: YgjV family protein [Alphaproteobacteria bacterium]|nr:YgjV family protein [Alphaproteobacteria bacterium]